MEWTDTLPLSRTEPFVYTTASASSSQRSRLQRYLSENGWSDSEITAEAPYPAMSASLQAQLGAVNSQLTPQTLMDLMWADFGLEDADLGCTEEEARLVLGVLYELELRRLVGNGFYVAPYVFTEDVTVDFISLLNDGGFDGVVWRPGPSGSTIPTTPPTFWPHRGHPERGGAERPQRRLAGGPGRGRGYLRLPPIRHGGHCGPGRGGAGL